MRTKKAVTAAIAFMLAILLSGCASTTAPRGWLPSAREAQQEAHGAWISLEYDTGSFGMVAEGEFIAVGRKSLFMLIQHVNQDTLIAIPLGQVKRGRLTTYGSKHGGLAVWTVLGSLSTGSHGVGAILSFPVWIISGSLATAAQSYAPIEKFPVSTWDELRKFARFPQGLPEGLDQRTLKSKCK